MNNEIAVLDTYTDAHMYQAMEGHEPNVLKAALACSVIIFLLWTCRFNKTGKTLLPIAFISLYPYIWYCVLVQHSIQHAYFTYKAQMITLWVVLLLGAEAIRKMIPRRKGANES